MLAKYKLSLIFFLCLLSSFIIPFMTSFYHFIFFAPFLIICFYQKSLWVSLWLAASVGIIDDIFSTSIFGLSSFNYVLVSLLLYRIKKHFFEDRASTLSIMTFFFSSLSIFIKAILEVIFSYSFPMTSHFFFTDIFLLPLFEGILVYVLYIFPYQFFKIGKPFLLKWLKIIKSH